MGARIDRLKEMQLVIPSSLIVAECSSTLGTLCGPRVVVETYFVGKFAHSSS